MSERRGGSRGDGRVGAVVFDLFSTLSRPVGHGEFRASLRVMARAVGVDPDAFAQGWSRSWRGEAIEALGELPGLIGGDGAV